MSRRPAVDGGGASAPVAGKEASARMTRLAADSLLTPSGSYDRAAIMRKAWRDYRRVRALGDLAMSFGDWLTNSWAVARAKRITSTVIL